MVYKIIQYLFFIGALCCFPHIAVGEVSQSRLASIKSSVEIEYIEIPVVDVPQIEFTIEDISYKWDPINAGMAPRANWVKAVYDCFGETGYYVPDSMSYLGWKWEDLSDRENKEGFTPSISKEWIELLKDLKPYIQH